MISIEWAVRKKLFRNANHAIWFVMSLWLAILTIAYYFYPKLSFVILLPVAIHFTALVQAISATYIKKSNSETLSRDCVWFNLLMVVIYIIIFFLSR